MLVMKQESSSKQTLNHNGYEPMEQFDKIATIISDILLTYVSVLIANSKINIQALFHADRAILSSIQAL